jgi:hypothetical protein
MNGVSVAVAYQQWAIVQLRYSEMRKLSTILFVRPEPEELCRNGGYHEIQRIE